MVERFIGTVKVTERGVNAKASLRLLKEGECIFESDDSSSNKVKCVFSNSLEFGKGEELIISEKEASTPTPKYEAFKYRKGG